MYGVLQPPVVAEQDDQDVHDHIRPARPPVERARRQEEQEDDESDPGDGFHQELDPRAVFTCYVEPPF
jgi:hypothetical protein